jgi:phenylalanyl-tRNA synthetase beta chain
MLVSWEWLSDYVELTVSPAELANRFAMSGLNHEATTDFAGDPVIDLEVTSNRGDCLGHIGIAREASVLLNQPLRIPQPILPALADEPSGDARWLIENLFLEGCPRYQARILRGVKVGPSPAWLKRRLAAIGLASINNVVDVTNYVMFECGQPLHAFDLAKLEGDRVVVRRGLPGEKFMAIDHRTYELDPGMVVIADARRAIALGGVMGGVDSEVTTSTTDLLLEAALFTPLAIRRAARKLRLHSPASYRFERRVDPGGLNWALDRCCQWIHQLAGGRSLSEMLVAGELSVSAETIHLRRSRLRKVLGIDVPWEKAVAILGSLGCRILGESSANANAEEHSVTVASPSFRGDLTREIDLIEEIARIYGYEQIPEDSQVPIAVSAKRPKDVLLERVRSVTTAAGLDEALTPSLIHKSANDSMSPWCDQPALQTQTPLLEGTTFLRRCLVPSLLQAYQFNQSLQQREASLFETATIYLPHPETGQLPREQSTLGWVAPMGLQEMAGMVEEMLSRVAGLTHLAAISRRLRDFSAPYLAEGSGVWLEVQGHRLAWYGQLSRSWRLSQKIDADLCVGEIDLDRLLGMIELIPRLVPIVPFPAIQRDLNLIMQESVRWQPLMEAIQGSAGPLLQEVRYRETYRDPQKDGPGMKRILLSLTIQSRERTLTSDQADEVVGAVVAAVRERLGAKLLA